MQAAVQPELDQFFANLRNRADSVRRVSAQAFYKARYKVSALVSGDGTAVRPEREHTSALSSHGANQDFGAKAVFDKLNALAS